MKRDDLAKVLSKLPYEPGIYGRDDYPNSVVMLLLAEIEGEYHFVFQKRSEHIRQGGEVCFPGGIFDRRHDQDRKNTAVRETCEELGISEDEIFVAGCMDTLVAPMGAVIDIFVGILKADPDSLDFNRDEVERVFTLPVTFFQENNPEIYYIMTRFLSSEYDEVSGKEKVYLPVKELGLPDRYLEPWGEFKLKVYVYKTPEEVIWGITAGIVADFIKYVRDDCG